MFFVSGVSKFYNSPRVLHSISIAVRKLVTFQGSLGRKDSGIPSVPTIRCVRTIGAGYGWYRHVSRFYDLGVAKL